MVRAGFRMLLAGEEDIEVVAEASNGLEAVDKAARFHPAVILMDVRMPELDGLQATRRILAADGDARILVLTTFDLDEYVYEALRAGASGFVLKDDSPEQLIGAIRTVAGGDALLSPTITRRVIQKFARMPRPAPPKDSTSSASANGRSFGRSRAACRMRRSRRSSSSAKRLSRRTSRTSSRSSISRPRPGGRARVSDRDLRSRAKRLAASRGDAVQTCSS